MTLAIYTWQAAAGTALFFFIAGVCWTVGGRVGGWLAGKSKLP